MSLYVELRIPSVFFFSSRRRHTRCLSDWSSDVCSSDLSTKALVDAGADIIGMNCLRPPEHMLGPLEEMRKAVPHAFVAAQPVAYRTPADKPDFTSLPQFPFELDPLQLSRREMAAYAQRARDIGVDYIGGCCGSVAIHIREMARVLGKLPAEQRPWKLNYQKPMSAYEYYDHDPEKVGDVQPRMNWHRSTPSER